MNYDDAWRQIINNRAFYNVSVRRGESWVDAACRTLDELIDQKEQAEKSLSEFLESQLTSRDDLLTQLDEARIEANIQRNRAQRERDEWKDRALDAERERDATQERADQLRDERDDAVQSCIAVGRARDAWKARADAAMKARHNVTRERDEALEASALFQRDVHEWRDRAEAAEKRHQWPNTTPTGHTYVAPDTYVALCHQHSNAAQAEVECWEADECPPEPTWEMVGIAHREVERLQRDLDEWKARAIEAEPADPVEEQTDALADLLYGHEMVTDQMRGVLGRVVRAGMLLPSEASSDE